MLEAKTTPAFLLAVWSTKVTINQINWQSLKFLSRQRRYLVVILLYLDDRIKRFGYFTIRRWQISLLSLTWLLMTTLKSITQEGG